MADDLAGLLKGLDVFWVGVHASVEVIADREKQRGNRVIGEALYHLRTHEFCRYDLEVDTTHPLDQVAGAIIQGWSQR